MKTERIADDKSYKILIEWKKADPQKFGVILKVCDSIQDYIENDSASGGSVGYEARRPDTCEWSKEDEDNNSYYETECGNAFECMHGDYQHNHFLYCPFCGRHIKDKIIEDESAR